MQWIESLIRWGGQLFCGHQWMRTRWDDGSYGYRCRFCLKAYPVTWEDLLAQTVPVTRPVPALPRRMAMRPGSVLRLTSPEPHEELKSFRRAA